MIRVLIFFLLLLTGACGREHPSPGSEVVPREPGPPEARRFPDTLRVVDSLGSPSTDPLPDTAATGGSGAPGAMVNEEVRSGEGAFPRPEAVRGIYLNAWTAGSTRRRERLIELARRTEVNAFVIDIKDATGFLSHPSEVPLAREVGATGELRIRDLPGLLARLREAGVYPIARIVVTKDPILTAGRPDLAIQDSAGGVWLDQDSVRWLNLHDRRVWDYHIDLAREVVRAGFPEIQWDYVRFPDAPESLRARAVFPGAGGRPSTEAVRAFLGHSREVLSGEGAFVTADVFGVTTSYRKDVGIGQVWESFIDQVDVALPMVYPSHYWPGSFGFQEPNAYPYEIVRRALRDAVRRSAAVEGAGAVRPWLQDFSLGAPAYGAPEVRAQIQATYDAGVREWILWNPGSRYTDAALIPSAGLPSWLEPVIRVGGEVVPVSRRFQVLGEETPEVEEEGWDTLALPELTVPRSGQGAGAPALPALPLPDTGGVEAVFPPDTGRVGRLVRPEIGGTEDRSRASLHCG